MPPIEETIAANTAALEANTKALLALAAGPGTTAAAAPGETAAVKKKREAAEKEAADKLAAAAGGPTLQEIRDLAAKIVDANEGAQIEALCKEFGIARASAAHGTDKAQAVYDRLKQINAKL